MGMFTLLSSFIGFAYPTYASFKAIESPSPEDDKQWLTYWVVYGVMTLAESWVGFLFMWFPFYSLLKFLFTLWLIAPQTEGAKVMYENVLRPFLHQHASTIDPVFKGTNRVLQNKMTGVVASLVEAHGPAAAETLLVGVTNTVLASSSAAASKLAKDPDLLKRALEIAAGLMANPAQASNGQAALPHKH